MRLLSVIQEAGRNLASGTSRAPLLAVIFVALIGAVSTVDVRSVVAVLHSAAEYRAAGAAVQTLQAGNINGSQCDALTGTPGVAGSGALREGERVRALNMPSTDLAVWEVTPGFPTILAATGLIIDHREGVGVWVSADLAHTLGATPGGQIATSAGDMPVAGIFDWPDDGRVRSLSYAILAPVPPTGPFEQCWAQIWPADAQITGLLFLALAGGDPDTGQQQTIGQLNASLGSGFDGAALLSARLTRSAPFAGLLLGLALGFVAIRLRRLELAAALHARVPKPHAAWQHLTEAAAWVSAAMAITAAISAYAASVGNPDPVYFAWLPGLRVIAAGGAGALLGTLIGVAAAREKHLFRYFKNR